MAFSVNGVSQVIAVGAVKNNLPANPLVTTVTFNQVVDGHLVPDLGVINPGVIV